jgi:single-strand DNA-binding protein
MGKRKKRRDIMYRNHIEVMGYVGSDPELKNSNNGRTFARVTVATTETWKDRDGKRQERTTWHTAFFGGKTAELAVRLLKKGSHVFVEGAMRSSPDTDGKGQQRERWSIAARDFRLLDRRERTAEPEEATPADEQAPAADDLPPF